MRAIGCWVLGQGHYENEVLVPNFEGVHGVYLAATFFILGRYGGENEQCGEIHKHGGRIHARGPVRGYSILGRWQPRVVVSMGSPSVNYAILMCLAFITSPSTYFAPQLPVTPFQPCHRLESRSDVCRSTFEEGGLSKLASQLGRFEIASRR